MKSLTLGMLALLCASSVLATDGNVPASTLSALGLGGMQRVSDSEGMQVRGEGFVSVSARGTIVISGQLWNYMTDTPVVFTPLAVSTSDSSSGVTPPPRTATVNLIVIIPPTWTFGGNTITGTVRSFGSVTGTAN